jgi:predicted amidophosphoribosyltransferase
MPVIRRHTGQKKLKKESCEICGDCRKSALNIHHIIPKCDPRCTNNNYNLSIVCHTCHDLIHAGEIVIIGVYDSTLGRKLMFFKQGEDPPLEKIFWKIKDNPMVVRRKKVSTTQEDRNNSTERI